MSRVSLPFASLLFANLLACAAGGSGTAAQEDEAGAGGGPPAPAQGGAGGRNEEPPVGGMPAPPPAGGDGQGGQSTAGAAGTAGPGGTAGAPACGAGRVCDSFESYAVGSVPVSATADAVWRIGNVKPGMLSVDDSRAFSGKQSIHIKVPKTTGGSAAAVLTSLHKDLFPATQIHARMMFYFDGVPMGASPFHWSFMQTMGAFAPGTGIARSSATLGLGGWYKSTRGGFQNVMVSMGGADGFLDCWNHAPLVVPTGKWVCIEWQIDGATHAQKVKIDGRDVSSLSFTEKPTASNGCLDRPPGVSWYVPPLNRFNVGYIQHHASDVDRNLWIDDVVMSQSPIGCPAAP